MSYTPSFRLPNVTIALVTHIGILSFSPDFLLDNMFDIPSFKFNPLSISQLIKSKKFQVICSSDSFEF